MANDNTPVPNVVLREAVTSVAFSLTLSRNQLGVLDAVAHGTRQVTHGTIRSDALWVPTAWQLKRRGLMVHVTDPDGWGDLIENPTDPLRPRKLTLAAQNFGRSINEMYRLTRAGWLVHDLAVEAGLVEAVTSRKQRKIVA